MSQASCQYVCLPLVTSKMMTEVNGTWKKEKLYDVKMKWIFRIRRSGDGDCGLTVIIGRTVDITSKVFMSDLFKSLLIIQSTTPKRSEAFRSASQTRMDQKCSKPVPGPGFIQKMSRKLIHQANTATSVARATVTTALLQAGTMPCANHTMTK